MSEINRNHVSFIAFLHHLVDEHDFNPSNIVDVVEKPWKWQAEFEQFLVWGHVSEFVCEDVEI